MARQKITEGTVSDALFTSVQALAGGLKNANVNFIVEVIYSFLYSTPTDKRETERFSERWGWLIAGLPVRNIYSSFDCEDSIKIKFLINNAETITLESRVTE